MRMCLIPGHCSCLATLCPGLSPLPAVVVIPCDAQLALPIQHVAAALDVLVFALLVQLVIPGETLLVLLVHHVALALLPSRSWSLSLVLLPSL